MDPRFPTAHWLLGSVCLAQGKFAEAIREFESARAIDETPAILSSLGHALAISGNHGCAQEMLDELDRLSLQRYVPPESQALIYAGMADRDRAFAWLNIALQARSSYLIYAAVDPRLDLLRADSRFPKILADSGSGE